MVNVFKARICSGSRFEGNPTTTEYTVTSEFLAQEIYDNKDDLEIIDKDFFNGIGQRPNGINDQRFYGSSSAILYTPEHEIIVCIYPRGDSPEGHINFNMRYHLKSNVTIFRSGDLPLPVDIHKVDAQRARIKLFDPEDNEVADNIISL